MAFGGLLSVLDDVTSVLDDVASMSKVAAGKTVTISGDDVAVNSQAVIGMDPKRELQIIWRIAKGSLVNKAILAPAGLALGAFAPAAIPPLLMVGGAYFCYEGVHKVLHRGHDEHKEAAPRTEAELKAIEDKKVKGAIRTDFLLSAEIMAITLGTVVAAPFLTQAMVMGAIGVAMTAGIYGFVGGIVKLDDLGLHMMKKAGDSRAAKAVRKTGSKIVDAAPKLLKGLAVLGTAAMIMVGGGLVMGGIPAVEHFAAHLLESVPHIIPHGLAHMGLELAAGAVAGAGLIAGSKAAAPVVSLARKGIAAVRARFSKKKNKAKSAAKKPEAEFTAPAADSKIKTEASIKNELNAKATPAQKATRKAEEQKRPVGPRANIK